MFGFSGIELIVIVLVAMLVIHPKDMPEMLRNIYSGLNKINQTAREFTQTLMADEAVEDLSKEAKKLNNEIKQIIDLNGDLQQTYSFDDIAEHLPQKHQDNITKK